MALQKVMKQGRNMYALMFLQFSTCSMVLVPYDTISMANVQTSICILIKCMYI